MIAYYRDMSESEYEYGRYMPAVNKADEEHDKGPELPE